MGTTRIKVIDLSSGDKEIKTSRKHAEKLTGAAKIKQPEKKKKIEKEEIKPQGDEKAEKPEEKSAEVAQKEVKEEKIKEKKVEEKKHEKATKKQAEQKHQRSKKYKEAKKHIENKPYNVADKNIKGNVTFPHSFKTEQKKQKYLIFSDSKKDVKGADVIWGNDICP